MEQILAIAEANASRKPSSGPTERRQRVSTGEVRRVEHGPRYVEVVFEAPPELLTSHRFPAQYITMGLADSVEPRFLVLANAPGDPVWRCLIGKDSTLGEAICALNEGASPDTQLHVSAAEGRGFVLPRSFDEHTPLIMLATGSGVATMHSVLRWLEHAHPHKLSSTSLFYSEHDEHTLAYSSYLHAMAQRGVEVTMAYESPIERDYPWQYVQQPLLQRADDALFARGLFLLSGARPMLRFVTHALLERGVDEGRILLNV